MRCMTTASLRAKAGVKKALHQAWDQDDADKAERLLRNLARRLEHEEPGHCHINWAGRNVRWILNWSNAPALL